VDILPEKQKQKGTFVQYYVDIFHVQYLTGIELVVISIFKKLQKKFQTVYFSSAG
jgi:hypothetical protein